MVAAPRFGPEIEEREPKKGVIGVRASDTMTADCMRDEGVECWECWESWEWGGGSWGTWKEQRETKCQQWGGAVGRGLDVIDQWTAVRQ